MSIVNNVRNACAKDNTNIFNLEAALGFPRGSIYKWDDHIPSVGKVKLVADFLGVSVDSLLDNVQYQPRKE